MSPRDSKEPALVEKKDGEIIGPYDATFTGSTIFIWDGTADVIEGDVILRNLPNGKTERSTITNATFYNVGTRGPHYQLKFTKGSTDSGIRASTVALDGVQIIADRMKLVLQSENKILEDEIRRITNYNTAKGKTKSGQTLIEAKAATIQIVKDRLATYVKMLDETALDWSDDLVEVLQKQVEILFSDHLGDLEDQLGKLYEQVGSQAGAGKVHNELIEDIRNLRSDLHLQLENKRIEYAGGGGRKTIDKKRDTADFDLRELLHPIVADSSYQLYCNGHLREAVLNSITAIFDFIRTRSKSDKDGDSLIGEVFSLQNPVLILSELVTESGENDQKGFMQIFKGAYQGVRNPKAHSLAHDLTPKKAAQYLVFASLLARRIEEANVVDA